MSNLPKWPGASAVYSKAYDCLDQMANISRGEESHDLIEALNEGDEERIKGLLLLYLAYGYYNLEKRRKNENSR